MVRGHEAEHLAVVEGALGDDLPAEPTFDFGDNLGSASAFAEAAAKLEDAAVGAYNGQAANVSTKIFTVAARIVSVEARHAAWVRSIEDRDPAPDGDGQADDGAAGARQPARAGGDGVDPSTPPRWTATARSRRRARSSPACSCSARGSPRPARCWRCRGAPGRPS